MKPHDIAFVLQIGLLIWLGLIVGLVAKQMLAGEIAVTGMLRGKMEDDPATVLPDRVALLLTTLGFGGYYIITTLRGFDVSVPTLPEVPNSVLAVLLGSQGVYLTRKIYDIGKRGP